MLLPNMVVLLVFKIPDASTRYGCKKACRIEFDNKYQLSNLAPVFGNAITEVGAYYFPNIFSK